MCLGLACKVDCMKMFFAFNIYCFNTSVETNEKKNNITEHTLAVFVFSDVTRTVVLITKYYAGQ